MRRGNAHKVIRPVPSMRSRDTDFNPGGSPGYPGPFPDCQWLSVTSDTGEYENPRVCSKQTAGETRTTLLPRKSRGRSVRRRWVTHMRQYEVMVILDPDLDERSIAPSLEQFLKVIREQGGAIEKTDIWGRRRLAYEIKTKSGKKVAEGIYAVVDI